VWVLYLDLYILNAAGCLLDTALLAALTALQDTHLPAVHLTAEGNVERGTAVDDEGPKQQQQQQGVPLSLSCQPLCLTCGLYKGRLVADPDHEEEALMGATISVVVDQQQRLLGEGGTHVPGVGGWVERGVRLCTVDCLLRNKPSTLCLKTAVML
jgi:exosome complex component RRP43